MIHVEPASEPEGFDAAVRQPGLRAIAELVGEDPDPVESRRRNRRGRPRSRPTVKDDQGVERPITRREDIPADYFPTLWRGEWLDELLKAYKRICAYVCIYIEPVTGAASVDHRVPVSERWDRVCEWTNYRLACSLMNSRRGTIQRVMDPFEVENGWFQLELTFFQVVPAPNLDETLTIRIRDTIDQLELNDTGCCGLRRQYAEDYQNGLIHLAYLERRAPFVAMELRRQGKLRADDTRGAAPQETS